MHASDLILFEAEIAEAFNAGKIRAPVHLSGGNEEDLIGIFERVRPEDWVFSTWRSHYHCLLKGVPPARLKADILAGKSITLTYPEHRIVTSAIVGGILPIALGVALAIKRAGGKEKVWAFVGDMASQTGAFSEVSRYAFGHNLPLMLVVEDNGISVCTDTEEVWRALNFADADRAYGYKLPWPHAGAGKRVQF